MDRTAGIPDVPKTSAIERHSTGHDQSKVLEPETSTSKQVRSGIREVALQAGNNILVGGGTEKKSTVSETPE